MFGFITVRLASSRLKEKALLDFGRFTVLGHVIERLRFYSIKPIVCTTDNKNDQKIIDIANNHKCMYFRGSEKNKIKRWLDCANSFDINYFHTIDCDDPFFCGDMIKDSMELLKKEKLDYISPNKRSNEGFGEVGFSINKNFLKNLNCTMNSDLDTEMIDMFFKEYKNGNYKQYNIDLNSDLLYRLTLDYQEDYWLLRTIIRILGQNPTRVEIEELFKNNPYLFKINFFRNKDWKKKQSKQNKNQKSSLSS